MTGRCDCPAGWAGNDCSQQQKRPCSAGGRSYAGPGTTPMAFVMMTGLFASATTQSMAVCQQRQMPHLVDLKVDLKVDLRFDLTLDLKFDLEFNLNLQDKDGHELVWGGVPYEKLYGQSGWCSVPDVAAMLTALKAAGVSWSQNSSASTAAAATAPASLDFANVRLDGLAMTVPGELKGKYPTTLLERPWLKKGVLVPPSGTFQPPPAATRKRPFIFVYDIPAYAAARMLQYRGPKTACVWRYFGSHNESIINGGWTYPLETLLHEMLLQSPHRTLDPEEADFFYVPAYTSCFMWPVHGWADYPWWYSEGGPRVMHMANMLLELKHHIQEAYPYWNRTQDKLAASVVQVLVPAVAVQAQRRALAGRPSLALVLCGRGVPNSYEQLCSIVEASSKDWNIFSPICSWSSVKLALSPLSNLAPAACACWFPEEVYKNSIILTHWGRLDKNHTSNTAYPPDNYNAFHVDDGSQLVKQGQPWYEVIKGHPCYTPGKDLVVPLPKFPAHFRWSPLLGAPAQKRTTLLYFRGDVGKHRLPNYSRGIRQRLYNLTVTRKWTRDFEVRIGDRSDVPGEYSLGLASSKYCLVAPGDGWSPRAEDAILHGCIPVVVMDEVHAVYESIIDWDAFSVRVAEKQLEVYYLLADVISMTGQALDTIKTPPSSTAMSPALLSKT
eukprot:gene4291-4543_t